MKSKFFISLFLILASAQASAGELPFTCENKFKNTFMYVIVTRNDGEYTGILSYGRGIMQEKVLVELLSVADAKKNRFAPTMARELKVDWTLVDRVEIYEVGNFSDDAAGVLGINFRDHSGALLAKGMYFGWAGFQKCLTFKFGK